MNIEHICVSKTNIIELILCSLANSMELIQRGKANNCSGVLANLDNFRLTLAASAYNARQGFVKFFSFDQFLFSLFFSIKVTINGPASVQYGEKCGGFGNADGVCSGGLGCLVFL